MTQLTTLKAAFNRGERLTVLTALTRYRVMALSQRAGELSSQGFPIAKGWFVTHDNKRVRIYSKGRKP